MLRLVAFAAVGGGIALLGSGFLFNASKPASGQASQAMDSTSSTPVVTAAGGSAASLTVKVMYFQMANYVNIKEEYFVLPSPARFSQLLSSVTGKHPVLTGMMPSMMVLVDGVSARPDTLLNEGDEIDFIPAASGG
jgi:molybdopterin converting factor small subunit